MLLGVVFRGQIDTNQMTLEGSEEDEMRQITTETLSVAVG